MKIENRKWKMPNAKENKPGQAGKQSGHLKGWPRAFEQRTESMNDLNVYDATQLRHID